MDEIQAEDTISASIQADDNLPARMKFSKTAGYHVYFFFVAIFTIAEPVFVSNSVNTYFFEQALILACSTLMFAVGLHIITIYGKEESYLNNLKNAWDGSLAVECSLLVFGWITLFYLPGLSPLRCLRVFCLAWHMKWMLKNDEEYLEVVEGNDIEEEEDPVNDNDDHDVAEENDNDDSLGQYSQDMLGLLWSLVISAWECVKFSSCVLLTFADKIGSEIFTSLSKGSIVILGCFFFFVYVFAVLYWNKFKHLTTPEGLSCGTLYQCFMTLMRLAFSDGTGLDFFQAVADAGNTGYAALLILFTILCGIIFLNGLIGVFGEAFLLNNGDVDALKEARKLDAVTMTHDVMRAANHFHAIWGEQRRQSSIHNPVEMMKTATAMVVDGNESTGGKITKLVTPVDKARDILSNEWTSFIYILISLMLSIVEVVVIAWPLPNLATSSGPHMTWNTTLFTDDHVELKSLFSTYSSQWLPYYIQIGILGLSTIAFPLGLVMTTDKYDTAVAALMAEGVVALHPHFKTGLEKYNVEGHGEWDDLKPKFDVDAAVDMVTAALTLSSEQPLTTKAEKRATRALERMRGEAEDGKVTYWDKIAMTMDAEVLMELGFLIFGWCTIFLDPAVSVLRVFRVFRVFRFFRHFKSFKGPHEDVFGIATPVGAYFEHTMRLCTFYIEKLFSKIPTKGALELLVVFFYVTYVFALMLWYSASSLEDVDVLPHCHDLRNCFITLTRLFVYDGNGFDFLTTLIVSAKSPWFGALVIVATCFNAMALLSGLIGIFGTAFSSGIGKDKGDDDDDDDGGADDGDGAGDGDGDGEGKGKEEDDDEGRSGFDEYKFIKAFGREVKQLLVETQALVDEYTIGEVSNGQQSPSRDLQKVHPLNSPDDSVVESKGKWGLAARPPLMNVSPLSCMVVGSPVSVRDDDRNVPTMRALDTWALSTPEKPISDVGGRAQAQAQDRTQAQIETQSEARAKPSIVTEGTAVTSIPGITIKSIAGESKAVFSL